MKTEPHPIELALVAVLVVADALAVLVAALLALVLSLASWRRSLAAAEWAQMSGIAGTLDGVTNTAPAPLQHPLAVLADQLEAAAHRAAPGLGAVISRNETDKSRASTWSWPAPADAWPSIDSLSWCWWPEYLREDAV